MNNEMKKEVNDKLKELFDKQEILQTRLKNIPFKNNKHKQEFININILACLDELSESLRETCWKNPSYISCGWKTTQEFNEENFKEELIDLWHFIINLSIASGMKYNELFERFCKKNKVNHERQDKKY